MKTSQTFLALTSMALGALLLTGCNSSSGETAIHSDDESSEGITFSTKNGLAIPSATAKFIGLQIADVRERKISTTLKFSAQVYRITGETALASGSISAADANKLIARQYITVQTSDGTALSAHITSVQSALEKFSEQAEVLLTISNTHASLSVGSSLTATAPLSGEQNVVSVPRSALLQTTEGDFVYAVNGAHYIRTAVKLGGQDEAFAEITDGLYAGDQIVVKPVMALWMAELQTLRGGKSCCAGH